MPGFIRIALRVVFVCLALPMAAASPERIAVYLIGGQSNAFGQGDSSALPPELAAPQTEVWFRHGTSGLPVPANTWVPLQPGSGASGGFGPELLCGRTLHTQVGSAATRIALIKYSKGGTSLSTDWLPGGNSTTTGDGPQYVIFQSTVQSALAALAANYPDTAITIEGMIWQQGERDAVIGTQASYQTNLTRFIADIRATYGSHLSFVVGQLSDGQTSLDPAALQTIQNAQAAVADDDPETGLVITDDLTIKPDALHFNTAGQILLGQRFAAKLLALPLKDADGNGLDDDWEESYWGVGATGQDPGADPDKDSRNNAIEFLWNTNPRTPDDPGFMISGPLGGMLTFSWNVRPFRRYLIESSYDLQTWGRMDSFVPPHPSGTNTVVLNAAGAAGFYRIGVQR